MGKSIDDLFAGRVSTSELARILSLLEEQPNRREAAVPGDVEGEFDYWLDGGAARHLTGWIEYEFSGGSSAIQGGCLTLTVEVRFPDGRRVMVRQEN